MAAHAPRQVVPPAPQQQEVEPTVPAHVQSNSAVQEQLEQEASKGTGTSPGAIGGVDGLASDNPLNTRQGGGRNTSDKKPGETSMTSDPFGLGVQHTTEESRVTRRKEHHRAEKRETDRTHHAGQIVDGNVQLTRTDVQERTRGKATTSKTETTHGVNIVPADPLSSGYTRSVARTDENGKTTSNSVNLNKDGASYTHSVSKGPHGGSFGVHGNTEEFGVHGGYSYQGRSGNSIGVNGHFSMLDRVTGKTVKRGDADNGLIHDDALRVSGADELAVHSRDNGLSVGLGVNAKLGVVGVQANGHYANETTAGYHTTDTSISDQERATRGEEMIRAKDGDLATKIEDLNVLGRTNDDGKQVAGLAEGEGITLQSTTSMGGGAGLSVYGIGGSGSYDTEQVQRTIVHRNDDGTYTFDITTGDLQQATGEGHVGGGVVAAGLKVDWGKASNINLTFSDDDQGRAKMQEFVKTGVIPGAVGEKDPDRATYERLAAKEDLTTAERAQLSAIADRVNDATMSADRFEATEDTDADVRIRTSKGEHRKSSVYGKTMGFEAGSSSSTDFSERFRYDERGLGQVGERGKKLQDNLVIADENIHYELNGEGRSDTYIDSEARNWEGEHRNEFENAGKTYPKLDSWRGSQTGEADVWADGKKGTSRAIVDITDGEISTFQEKAKNLDLTSLTASDRAAVEREVELRAKAERPLTNDELAGHLARAQAEGELRKLDIHPDDPDFASILEETEQHLLKGGSDTYLEGRNPDDLIRAAQEVQAPLKKALQDGRASDLQHALAKIESGGDFTAAPYEVRRALLDRVVAGEAGTEDLKNVSFDNQTWQAALAMLSNGEGQTDRARVFQGQITSEIDAGRDQGSTKNSSANRVLDLITHVIPDIGDLPQHDRGQDPKALQRFLNDQVSITRH